MKKAMKQSTLTFLLNGTSILLILLSIAAFVGALQATTAVNTVQDDRHELTYNANRFMNGSAYLTSEVRAYAATADRVHYDNYWNEVNNLQNRDIGVQTMRDVGITPAEDALIREMQSLSDNLIPLEEQAMQLAANGRQAEALEAVFGDAYETEITKIRALQTQFLDGLELRTQQAVLDAEQRLSGAVTLLILSLAVTALLQITAALVTHRKVIRPLIGVKDEMQRIALGSLSSDFHMQPDTSEIGLLVGAITETKQELNRYIADISKKLELLAKGDMTAVVDLEYIGDFASIKQSMETILTSLNEIMGEILASAGQVSIGAQQMAQTANSLSIGASTQAATLEEFTATTAEISAMARENSALADEALQGAQQATTLMDNCIHTTKQLTDAMDHIGHNAEEINKVIKTINDIAFQTNILALNASVEATRAGQFGKGFSVVASEVRNLANKSAQAAKETTELIQTSSRSVSQGTSIVTDVSRVIYEINDITQQNSRYITQINQASEQQSTAMAQLSEGIDHLADTVQTNSSAAQQSAATAEEMAAQSEAFHAIVSRFKLRDSAVAAAANVTYDAPVPREQGLALDYKIL